MTLSYTVWQNWTTETFQSLNDRSIGLCRKGCTSIIPICCPLKAFGSQCWTSQWCLPKLIITVTTYRYCWWSEKDIRPNDRFPCNFSLLNPVHYSDIIMSMMASQIADIPIVYLLFMHRSKKTSKLRLTDLCQGNSLVTGEFPAQRASNAEKVSISGWGHHGDVHIDEIKRLNILHLTFFRKLSYFD